MSSSPLRVQLVDPSAFTPPYDHALAGALARAGADVELVTSRFAYGAVPRGSGYAVTESFYRIAPGAAGSRLRMLAKLAQHVPDMVRFRAHARGADVVHFQWLTVQPLDVHLLPPRRVAGRRRPLVLTAHDVLPREPRPGQLDAQRRLYERVDAVVVHSEHGAARLREELAIDPAKVHVIPHGAFTHFVPEPSRGEAAASGAPAPGGAPPRPLPPELAAVPRERPVVLCFGLLRPYKGVDVLLEAWRGIDDAELWIVGLPKLDLAPLRAAAPPNVRFVPRFVADDEIAAFFSRADLVVLPYREIDQSGVLFTALAFGNPLLLTAVGGFPEVAATGAAELVPPGDSDALHAALTGLLADPAARARLAAAARAAAAGPYAWDAIAERTLALYRSLL
ncbi:glycosyltransferase family 4 protein [Conexibacter stalactiti]|uniref:Glycosyltransferase family 4 protein n=1 Tax=Conexibacter stalactiti TaxID=1940611 RepID=A0ABU4HI07_9ACTN|nr:glycosyltransferase family 4 protein [Conexibacter stalactiti]MDW5592938.1 glycosyltransferase family 4 protein [Conexibacter stalactiti]MEC5033579.1 glycosyltransferase family 4 protein [Conexibacter stalactiti]